MHRPYVITATPVHCFAPGCPHLDPRHCLMRVPPFHIKKRYSAASDHSCSSSRPDAHAHPHAHPHADAASSSNLSSTRSTSDCSLSDPSSAAASACAPDRLAKSRAVGQSHRDSERDHIMHLLTAVADGRLENSLLYRTFSYSYKRGRIVRFGAAPSPAALRLSHRATLLWHIPSDCAEDALPHLRPLLYPLSPHAQRMLGQRMVSGATACTLLELLMNRRNMWGSPHAMLNALEEQHDSRRRRRPYRAATTAAHADTIVALATRLYSREAACDAPRRAAAALRDHVQQRLGNLAVAAFRLDHAEASSRCVLSLVHHAPRACDYPPLPPSPTTPFSAEFESPAKMRRLDGARRCSRCGLLKAAGSGHARSKCPDGLSISSLVPYPCLPRVEL